VTNEERFILVKTKNVHINSLSTSHSLHQSTIVLNFKSKNLGTSSLHVFFYKKKP